jgi:hypothetical protein
MPLFGLTAFQGLQLAMGAVSAIGQMQAGAAAAGTAEQQAEQMEIDGVVKEAQAMENMSVRMDQYYDATATNDTIFSFMLEGAESTSIEAFKESERKVLVKDIDTLGRNMNLEKGATKLAALIEVERGKNAQRASFFNAVSTMGNAYINMRTTKVG